MVSELNLNWRLRGMDDQDPRLKLARRLRELREDGLPGRKITQTSSPRHWAAASRSAFRLFRPTSRRRMGRFRPLASGWLRDAVRHGPVLRGAVPRMLDPAELTGEERQAMMTGAA
jgi:hypothetical protein